MILTFLVANTAFWLTLTLGGTLFVLQTLQLFGVNNMTYEDWEKPAHDRWLKQKSRKKQPPSDDDYDPTPF